MSRPAQLDRLEIECRGPLDGQIEVPGSKSITNRALLLAALAQGESRLLGGLESDDTVVMRAALAGLGIAVETETSQKGDAVWRVDGRGGQFEIPDHALDCGNSGTTVRFLTAATPACANDRSRTW